MSQQSPWPAMEALPPRSSLAPSPAQPRPPSTRAKPRQIAPKQSPKQSSIAPKLTHDSQAQYSSHSPKTGSPLIRECTLSTDQPGQTPPPPAAQPLFSVPATLPEPRPPPFSIAPDGRSCGWTPPSTLLHPLGDANCCQSWEAVREQGAAIKRLERKITVLEKKRVSSLCTAEKSSLLTDFGNRNVHVEVTFPSLEQRRKTP